MTQESTKKTYRKRTEEETRLRKDYHLIFDRGTYVFSWSSKDFPRIREGFGTNLDRAKKKALQWIELIEAGKNPRLEEQAKSMTIEDLFTEVIQRKRLRNISPKSIRRYESVARNFIYWFGKKRVQKVETVTDTLVSEYFYEAAHKPVIPNGNRKGIRAIRVNGASTETIKFEKTFLSHAFDYAVSKGVRVNNPVTEVKTFTKHSTESDIGFRSFYEHEIPALLDAADKIRSQSAVFGNCTMREILEFLLLTGLRENELLHLQWTDVLWDETQNGCITIEPKRYIETMSIPLSHAAYPIFSLAIKGKQPRDFVFSSEELKKLSLNHLPIRRIEILSALKCADIQMGVDSLTISFAVAWKPKGKSGRVPLTQNARQILDAIAARKGTEGYVFQGRNGGKIQAKLLNVLNDIINLAQLKTAGRKLSLHSTRHAYGFRLRQKGVRIETIQELMRHSSIKDTMRYARYDIATGAEAIQVLDLDTGEVCHAHSN